MEFQYRHEWKHELNTADLLVLRARLRAVMDAATRKTVLTYFWNGMA